MPPDVTSAPVQVSITRHKTPVGTLTVAVSADAVLYCAFAEPEAVRQYLTTCQSVRVDEPARAQTAFVEEVRAQLDSYLRGRLRAFSLPVDLRTASPFVRQTVAALDGFVTYGRTETYGGLAARLRRPGAARAVGRALGANPVCVIEPCHRIVAASGRISGYAGGEAAKRYLLDLETSHPS
ncbi:methylated-DNA--[protein]-cysteine S-methyltransferase [Streptomyces sp. NPDC013978]|uniref:methylated-DNA--[protein]-cysteine S-methyltransferase n=1 Tax=Streptomyces sp. NPDC013978 TaxID=3364869 RepID=UPI0036F50CED